MARATRYTGLLIRSGYPASCPTVHAETPAAHAINTPPARARLLQGKVRYCITVIALLLAVLTQWLGTDSQPFAPNEWLRDQLIALHNTDAADPRILVVDIDEASLTALGPWPWPRDRLADLAEILLTRYSANGVAFDILLPEAGSPDGDQRLALLAQHSSLVLAQSFDYSTTRPQPLREGQLAAPYRGPVPAAVPATGYLANHAGLAQARHVGNIGFIPDADGALRRLPLYTSFEGNYYPTLTLALIQCCNKKTDLPAIQPAWMRIDYQRDWSAYTVVSAADILAQRIDPASASERLVLVGSSSLGIGDRVTTPLAANRPGLGVQAAFLSTLLDWQSGSRAPRWPGRWLAAAYALATVLGLTLALPRLAAITSVTLLALCSLLWLPLAYLISIHDAEFATTGPLFTNLFLLAVAVPYQWQLTQRRSRHLLDTLRQYVAPSVVTELLRSDLADPLQPRALDVTTLIADMEGYTTQVESLPVEAAATLTRDFLDCLTGPVISHQGTLDKYTGDGLVAFWGAPLPQQEHADLAMDAACAIVRRVQEFSRQRVAAGYPPLRVRIGIESGPAMAGDFGTSFRSIYTAVGDSVNTAARLEQAAREFPHDIIVGAGTVARARRHRFTLLGERRLRGKEHLTTLYTTDPSMTVASPDTSAQQQAGTGT